MFIGALGEPIVLAWIATFTFFGYVSAFIAFNYLKSGRVRNVLIFPIFIVVTLILTALIRQTSIGSSTLAEISMLIAAPYGAALGLILNIFLIRRWDRLNAPTK